MPQTNAPSFDPLYPTPEQEAEMVQGFRDGLNNRQPPTFASIAYEHGFRMARNDRARVVDADQVQLIARARQEGLL